MKSAEVPHAKRIKPEVFEPHELCSHFLQPPTPPPPHFGHSVLPPPPRTVSWTCNAVCLLGLLHLQCHKHCWPPRPLSQVTFPETLNSHHLLKNSQPSHTFQIPLPFPFVLHSIVLHNLLLRVVTVCHTTARGKKSCSLRFPDTIQVFRAFLM